MIWLPLILALTAFQAIAADSQYSIKGIFDIVRAEVCDKNLYTDAVGHGFRHVYIPWLVLQQATILESDRHKGCSMLTVGTKTYLLKGTPIQLLNALEPFGANVLILKTPK